MKMKVTIELDGQKEI